jgi:hypothetical protein
MNVTTPSLYSTDKEDNSTFASQAYKEKTTDDSVKIFNKNILRIILKLNILINTKKLLSANVQNFCNYSGRFYFVGAFLPRALLRPAEFAIRQLRVLGFIIRFYTALQMRILNAAELQIRQYEVDIF